MGVLTGAVPWILLVFLTSTGILVVGGRRDSASEFVNCETGAEEESC